MLPQKPVSLIRRYNNIIAFKSHDLGVSDASSVIAFHAHNLEVAELSEESFENMTSVEITNGAIPALTLSTDLDADQQEALSALEAWDQESNPNAKSGQLNFGIRSLTLNVNQICNLKCTYCAAGGDGTYGQPTNQISIEKTLPQLKFFLGSLKPGQKFGLTFVGGEPLLHPEAIHAIYTYVQTEAQNKNISAALTIVTNGTLLTGKTLEIIRSMKVNLIISLDGAKEINDIVRPTKNKTSSTDMTVTGLQNLAQNRGEILSIGLTAVCAKENPETFAAYKFLSSLNPDWMEFNFAYSENSAELQKNYIEQMNMIAAEAWARGQEKELRKIKQFDHYFKLLDSQQRVENHCGAGKTYLMVDAKNKLYTCPWVVGDPSEVVGENEQLDYDKLSKYSKSLVELNNCQSCWAKNLCGGGCMYIHKQHTGDKHKKDKLFCERTRSLILTSIMYYKLSRAA